MLVDPTAHPKRPHPGASLTRPPTGPVRAALLARLKGHGDLEETMRRRGSALADRPRTLTLLRAGDRAEEQQWGSTNFPGHIERGGSYYQLLSGRAAAGAYLAKIKRVQSSECWCYHLFARCRAWLPQSKRAKRCRRASGRHVGGSTGERLPAERSSRTTEQPHDPDLPSGDQGSDRRPQTRRRGGEGRGRRGGRARSALRTYTLLRISFICTYHLLSYLLCGG